MPTMNPDEPPVDGWPDPAAAGRHLWHDFESETELSSDGSGDPQVYHLIIAEPHGEEIASITHRATPEHPIDGERAQLKRRMADWITDALDAHAAPMPTLTDTAVVSGLRTTTAASLLADYELNDRRPYAIVSKSTGSHHVIEGEIYQTYNGYFVHVEIDTGVLRLPMNQEKITVADTRDDVPHPSV